MSIYGDRTGTLSGSCTPQGSKVLIYGGFRKFGVPYFWGPDNKDPII